MNIYLDIETIPTQDQAVIDSIAEGITPPGNISKADTIAAWHAEKKPGLIEEAVAKTSFDGALGHIACASIAIDDEAPVVFYREDWKEEHAEMMVLGDLFGAIREATKGATRKPTFIGHNILEFDLRFIFQRAVILGVRPPACIPFRAKPWGDEVFDTMNAWGGRTMVGMTKICRALGIEGKGDIDGSKVWEYVRTGRIAEVAAYCAQDVERTRAMYRRMTFATAA